MKRVLRHLRFLVRQFASRREWRKLLVAEQVKLELGSGPKRGRNGWTTVDMALADITHDLKKGIPLPDNSVNAIYSSHFLEHLTYAEILQHLSECRRVLRPGGQILSAVPSARLFIDAYINRSKIAGFPGFDPAYNYDSGSPLDLVNYIAYMGGQHHYMFDEENLVNILRKVGFVNAEPRSFIEGLDLQERDYGTIYFSANKS